MLRSLIDHVSSGNLYENEKFQLAYKLNHSTETALKRIQNDTLMALDNKSGVMRVLLDLSATFDTVHHTLLMTYTQSTGITNVTHQWFESYVSSRSDIVYLGQTQLDLLELLW